MQSMELVVLPCHKITLLHHVQLVHQLLWKAAFQTVVAPPPLRWCLCMGLFFTRYRTRHFPWLSFRRFLWAHFSGLSRPLWMAADALGVSAAPHSFAFCANLLRVHFVPSLRSLTKMLNNFGPTINPWSTSLVAGLQMEFAPLITTF